MDSTFDKAMQQADEALRGILGSEVTLFPENRPRRIQADFYDPHVSGHVPGIAAVLDGSLPTLFVSSQDIQGLKERDAVLVGHKRYWVHRIGPDDCGSRHISLKEGKPPGDARYQRK